jgi:hypothetical protein
VVSASENRQPPVTGTASASGPDLGGVFVRPPGFVPLRDDPLSGPIQGADGVRKVFTDHPEDPSVIVSSGFAEGYAQAWRLSVPEPQPFDTAPPVVTLATSFVLRFDTPAHARTVVEHFRRQNARDGYQFFTVPPELADGFGAYQKQGGPAQYSYFYSVAWTEGQLLFDVTIGYDRQQPSPDPVIALAVAQHEAAQHG